MSDASSSCLFCRIARKEIPSKIVYEDADLVAFRDIDPKAPTHILIIPRAHVATLSEMTDEKLLGRLLKSAADIARQEGIAEGGYRAIVNTNADGGQTVYHLHLHLLGGRHMHWPPG